MAFRPGRPAGSRNQPSPNYLRTAEAADLLHVSPKTVARWAKEGKLPFRRTLGGHARYDEATIRALVADLTEPVRAVAR